MSLLTWSRRAVSVFFEYDTPRIVHIRSKKVGILSRLVQTAILSYIVGWVIIYEKGYQQFDSVTSAVTTKLKGVVLTNFSDQQLVNVREEWRHLYNRVWDVTDYVIPPSENNAFFVMTNVIITPNQTLGECAEESSIPGSVCKRDEDCQEGEAIYLSHGINTGKCVPTVDGSGLKSCQVKAWCPVELDQLPMKNRAVLEGAKEFTVLIKNQIEFPMYSMRRSNILDSSNSTYLASCLYNEATDPFCPIFKLDTIVQLSGVQFSEIAVNGGVISVGIQWDCDLDYDFMKHCRPIYRFRRLDDPHSKIAPGWNFRRSQYYGNDLRTLYKSYGILFVLDVQGRAGKFSFIPFLINLGAGLALLGVATVICDLLILHCMKDREVYREKKYLHVKGSDAFNVYRTLSGNNSVSNEGELPRETEGGSNDHQE